MRTIEINVTQEDIDAGCVGSAYACPVARAMRRAGLGEPAVWGCSAYVTGRRPWGRVGVPLPERVEAAIGAYDRGEGMEPFTFTLEIPE